MKIDHVAIYVKDLEAVKEFYITLRCNSKV